MKKAIKYLCTLEGLLVYIIFSNYYQLKNFSFTFFECIKSFQSLTKTYLIYCAPELYWWIWIRNFQIYKKRNFTEYITNHVYFGERQCQLTLLIISKPSSSNVYFVSLQSTFCLTHIKRVMATTASFFTVGHIESPWTQMTRRVKKYKFSLLSLTKHFLQGNCTTVTAILPIFGF